MNNPKPDPQKRPEPGRSRPPSGGRARSQAEAQSTGPVQSVNPVALRRDERAVLALAVFALPERALFGFAARRFVRPIDFPARSALFCRDGHASLMRRRHDFAVLRIALRAIGDRRICRITIPEETSS